MGDLTGRCAARRAEEKGEQPRAFSETGTPQRTVRTRGCQTPAVAVVQMAKIAVVVPVFNGEACLGELYRRLVASVSTITDDFELIFVEDSGADSSWEP